MVGYRMHRTARVPERERAKTSSEETPIPASLTHKPPTRKGSVMAGALTRSERTRARGFSVRSVAIGGAFCSDLGGGHDDHGAVGVLQHGVGDAAEHQ